MCNDKARKTNIQSGVRVLSPPVQHFGTLAWGSHKEISEVGKTYVLPLIDEIKREILGDPTSSDVDDAHLHPESPSPLYRKSVSAMNIRGSVVGKPVRSLSAMWQGEGDEANGGLWTDGNMTA
jgi:hypothetical protein